MKLCIEPRQDSVLAIDVPTLVQLLNTASLEAFGNVGAGAISALGDGIEVVWLQNAFDAKTRHAIVKIASS